VDEFKKSFKLLCPGPVNVWPEIASALTEYEFCHREEEFSALFESVQRNALAVAGIREPDKYTALLVTGSGTAGNESVLNSVVDTDDVVVVMANGEFGERLGAISKTYNPKTEVIEHAWGELYDLERFEARLAQGDVKLVAMVHHETSTGFLNPVEDVGAICHKYGVRLFLDAVSSFSADRLDLEASHVTFMTTSSGKALASYPGVALLIGVRAAFEALSEHPARNHYLDLRRYYAFSEKYQQTPNTPAVPLILSLNRALELALREGREERLARLEAYANHVRKRCAERGLETLNPLRKLSNAVTSVRIPSGVAFEDIRLGLRAEGFVIYGGKGPFQNEIFQVATFGNIDLDIIDEFFDALDRVLDAAVTDLRALAGQ